MQTWYVTLVFSFLSHRPLHPRPSTILFMYPTTAPQQLVASMCPSASHKQRLGHSRCFGTKLSDNHLRLLPLRQRAPVGPRNLVFLFTRWILKRYYRTERREKKVTPIGPFPTRPRCALGGIQESIMRPRTNPLDLHQFRIVTPPIAPRCLFPVSSA